MSQNTQEPSVEETLEKTDFGHVINENKKLILIGGVVIVVAIFIYSFYAQSRDSQSNLELANAYDFKANVIDKYTDKKIKADEFVKQMKTMPSSIKGEVSILPSVLVATKDLALEGKKEEAKDILLSWQTNFSKGSYSHFFTTFNLTQIYDDLGKTDEAIDLLQELKKGSIDLLKSKILLDLARLQISKNQNEEARNNLNIIIKDYKDSAEVKDAKFYLSSIGEK